MGDGLNWLCASFIGCVGCAPEGAGVGITSCRSVLGVAGVGMGPCSTLPVAGGAMPS